MLVMEFNFELGLGIAWLGGLYKIPPHRAMMNAGRGMMGTYDMVMIRDICKGYMLSFKGDGT